MHWTTRYPFFRGLSDSLGFRGCPPKSIKQIGIILYQYRRFLAPTGALEEGILSVRACVCSDFPQKNTTNEFLKHSKESRGVLGQAGKQEGRQVGRQAGRQAGRQVGRQAGR